MRWLYNLGFFAVAPLILVYMLWRSIKQPAYLRRWRERYGFASIAPKPGGLWVHAVSVGEFQAALPLINALKAKYPERDITVTTMTPTGSERVQDVLGDTVQHCYLPYDYPFAVKRFLNQVQPDLAIVVETEIWPNLFYYTHKRGVPILMASARLSLKSVNGYLRIPGPSLVKQTLSFVKLIAAQGPADVQRFNVLGAEPEQIEAIGNIKFDVKLDEALPSKGLDLRASWGEGRPVLVAGSTHEGEEAVILEAFAKIRAIHPTLLLVMVPRHPQRFDTVASWLDRTHYSFVRRSENGICCEEKDIYLIDTLGELPLFYAAGDIAFVGGSLVPVGGHNLLEPAALGKPVLAGPLLANCIDIAELMEDRNALRIVENADQLAETVVELFNNDDLRHALGGRARQMVSENRGAVQRLVERVDQALPQ